MEHMRHVPVEQAMSRYWYINAKLEHRARYLLMRYLAWRHNGELMQVHNAVTCPHCGTWCAYNVAVAHAIESGVCQAQCLELCGRNKVAGHWPYCDTCSGKPRIRMGTV